MLVLEKSPRASTLGSIKYVLRRWIPLYVRPGFQTQSHCMFSCFLQIHCDFRNTRKDSWALPGVNENRHTPQWTRYQINVEYWRFFALKCVFSIFCSILLKPYNFLLSSLSSLFSSCYFPLFYQIRQWTILSSCTVSSCPTHSCALCSWLNILSAFSFQISLSNSDALRSVH